MARLLLALVALLGLSLTVKAIYLWHPSRPDIDRLERDLAKLIAPAGYRLQRSKGKVLRFAAVRGHCRANLALAEQDGFNLFFIRELHRSFGNRAEFLAGQPATSLPRTHFIRHYISRAAAPIGIDWPVTPYFLIAWDGGCPPPARSVASVRLHYRAGPPRP